MDRRDGSDGIIKTENLTYSIGDKEILKGIDLTIPEGKISVIIGPSGSGKSTLLQLLAGLLEPTGGRIIIGDTDITSLPYHEKFAFRKENIGIMFQELGLFDWLTVEENIAFPLKIHHNLPEDRLKARVDSIIEALKLRGTEKLYPEQLSGGMQRRVALGRILALNPRIILLDEPTSGLDPVISASVEEMIKKINRETGKTFVIISHVIETTLNLAHYMGVIFRGELIEFGSREKILESRNPVIKQYFTRSTTGPITADI